MIHTRFKTSKRAASLLGVAALVTAGFALSSRFVIPRNLSPGTASQTADSGDKSTQHAILSQLVSQRLQPVPGARPGTFEEMSRVMTRNAWNDMTGDQHHLARQMLLAARKNGEIMDFCFRQGTPPSQMRAFEALTHSLESATGPRTNFQPTFGRWSSTATNPSVDRNQPLTLTWNLSPDTGANNIKDWAIKEYGSEEAFRVRCRAVFALWSTHTNITYQEVNYDDGADGPGVLGVRPDVRISGAALTGGAVGVNSNPNFGDMTLKTDDDFFAPSNDSRGERLFNTMTHEHGHGIGLSHSCPQDGTKVMEPAVNEAFHGAQFDDILSAQFLYGDQYEKGDRNNTVKTATDLGTVPIFTSTGVSDVSLNIDDVDYYKVTPDSSQRSITVIAKPAGTPYLEAAQNADASCPAGTLFDPTKMRNLDLAIIDSLGNVVATSNTHPVGGTESITQMDLTDAGPYYIRVSSPDTADTIVAYTLSVAIDQRNNQPPVISDLRFNPKRPGTDSVLKAQYSLSDPDGDEVTATTTWTKNGNPITVTGDSIDLSKPGAGDDGDVFQVTVHAVDAKKSTADATITVTIRPANVKPDMPDASFTTKENKPISGTLKFSDPNSKDANAVETLTVKAVAQPAKGTVVVNGDGTFVYTPKTNFNGKETFRARVTDQEGLYDEGTFTVTVTPVNYPPVAEDDVVNTSEDVQLTIPAAKLLKNDSNGEASGETDALSIVSVRLPSNFPGTLTLDQTAQTILFTPKLNWNGQTSFGYTVQDSHGQKDTGNVTLNVAPVNDAPTADDLSLTTVANTPAQIELSGSDVEDDLASFVLVAQAQHGHAKIVLVGNSWILKYVPNADYFGSDLVTYSSRDGHLNSVPAKVSITVKQNFAPTIVSLAPNVGKLAEGASVIFTEKVNDKNGTGHLDAVSLLISNSATSTNAKAAVALWFDAVNNVFTMVTDDGKTLYTPVALGQTLYNSQASVTLSAKDVTREADGTLTLRWRVTFKKGFLGDKTLWCRVEDLGGAITGYSKLGAISLTAPKTTKATSPVASSANNS